MNETGQQRPNTPSAGVQLIAEERASQVGRKGYTPAHDATHTKGKLIVAAIAYAVAAHDQVIGENLPSRPPAVWPFSDADWHRAPQPVRNLVKAGALIAAEVDRLLAAKC